MPRGEGVVRIYTDGGCVPNPGIGGWGAILAYGDACKELSGGEEETTNNRMELTAAVRALEALRRPCDVELYTDSQYLKNGITEWLPAWKRKGWQRSRGVLKNKDLWQKLDALVTKHRVAWHWVRGHAGNVMNERCDELAEQEIIRLRGRG